MKKIILCMLTVVLFLLCACQETGTKKLDTPENVFVTEENILFWKTVDGASFYIVTIDEMEQPKTINTNFDLNTLNLKEGQTVSIRIKAIGDGYVYLNSESTNAISHTITKVNKPSVPSGDKENHEFQINKINNVTTEESKNVCTFVESDDSLEKRIVSSYTDAYNKRHYVVYMGLVRTVPISTSPAAYKAPGATPTIVFAKEEIKENALTETVSEIVTDITSGTIIMDFGVDIILDVGVTTETTFGREESTETATSVTTALSESISTSITYTINENAPEGCYRISLFSFCDAYYILELSGDEKEPVIEKSKLTFCPRREECYTVLEYLGAGNVPTSKLYDIEENFVDLPESFYKMLPVPTNEVINVEDVLIDKDTTTPVVITDSGFYGYGCTDDKKDTITLSKYSNFFKENYLFCFNVSVDISEKDDGYQEIYLYNKKNDNPSTSELSIHELKQNKGLLCGVIIEHEPGKTSAENKNYNFTWYVSGENVKETMYIYYDAYGEGEDSWNKGDIRVKLNIIAPDIKSLKSDKIHSSTSSIEVNDDGSYGQNATRPKEKVKLDSKYDLYKTNEYLYMFDVSIDLKEKEDGYQEIYFYDNIVSDGISNIEQAIEKGLLGAMTFCHGPGKTNTATENYKLTWFVKGDKITDNTLYICYDAFGKGLDKDTWIRESISIDLKVYKVPKVENDKNVRVFMFAE